MTGATVLTTDLSVRDWNMTDLRGPANHSLQVPWTRSGTDLRWKIRHHEAADAIHCSKDSEHGKDHAVFQYDAGFRRPLNLPEQCCQSGLTAPPGFNTRYISRTA